MAFGDGQVGGFSECEYESSQLRQAAKPKAPCFGIIVAKEALVLRRVAFRLARQSDAAGSSQLDGPSVGESAPDPLNGPESEMREPPRAERDLDDDDRSRDRHRPRRAGSPP